MSPEGPKKAMAVPTETPAPRPWNRPAHHCAATTKAGAPCTVPPLHGSDFCWCHDPTVDLERRQAARIAGGENRRRRALTAEFDVLLTSAEECRDVLADTISKVRRGQLDLKFANSIGYLMTAGLKAVQMVELERRIAELEEAAGSGKASR